MMITLKNVTKEYNKGNIGLEDVSLDIAKGEFVFIVGKSGSGKTTLMKLLQKELDVTSGQIIVNGQDYKKLTQRNLPKFRRQMGMVFQDFLRAGSLMMWRSRTSSRGLATIDI